MLAARTTPLFPPSNNARSGEGYMRSLRIARVSELSLAIAVLAVGAGCTEPTSGPTEEADAAAAAASAAAVGDRYIILLREDNARLRAASVGASLARMGGRIERDHAQIGVLSVRGLTAAAAAQVAREADVEALVKDRAVRWVKPEKRER